MGRNKKRKQQKGGIFPALAALGALKRWQQNGGGPIFKKLRNEYRKIPQKKKTAFKNKVKQRWKHIQAYRRRGLWEK